jgi:hypothetical protein
MPKPSDKKIRHLCKTLAVETHFLKACLEASVVEIYETKGHVDLGNGTALRLRRLQRICLTFEVDLPVALILAEFRNVQ